MKVSTMPSNDLSLFTPVQLRSVTARNRLWISPMCMYSVFEEDGIPTDWHLVHYGSRAVGGAGLIIVEATAVEPRGRISPQDLGLWDDAQVPAFAGLARFMAGNGAVPAVQLGHAGRKAGVAAAIGPSAQAFSANTPAPQAMSQGDIEQVILAFQQAARRASEAGFQAVEIHSAHGYLLHQFLSPLSNQRDDSYGGDFDGRVRLHLAVVRAVRAVWPAELPLLVRISATDWAQGGWDLEQSIELARRLKDEGVDLIDVSSGGLTMAQQIRLEPGYQVPFAARIRQEARIATGAVGLISEAPQANAIVRDGQADAVLIARQSLRDPYWPLRAAVELGAAPAVPTQYGRGW